MDPSHNHHPCIVPDSESLDGSADNDPLVSGFIAPPDSAKPRVWWHWMNGNVTKEGIERDLRWMKRIGVGGVQNFDGALETPQIVEQRLQYMTSAWRDAFKYAVRRAEELELEFAIASSPGWSATGGPWVEPKDGMKKLVWSETRITGGKVFKGVLLAPPSDTGPFQNIPLTDPFSSKECAAPEFYRDAAVVAYRTPTTLSSDPKPVAIKTSINSLEAQSLANGDRRQVTVLPVSRSTAPWIVFDYGVSMRFRAMSIAHHLPLSFKDSVKFVVECSTDGETFQHVTELSGDWNVSRTTVDFGEVNAQYLRLRILLGSPVKAAGVQFGANAPGAQAPANYMSAIREVGIRELRFYSSSRIHRFESKSGFNLASNYTELENPSIEPEDAVNPKDVIDLAENVSVDGILNWHPPEGEWTVLRLGYSLTGKKNHPASREATGLEVDKLDKKAVKIYLDHYLASFEHAVGPEWIGGKGIRAFLTDSIEAGGQNWTLRFIDEFAQRRGYSLLPWFPALTGIIVGDRVRTDQFLWDFRKTLADLMTEAHYMQIADSVHERGMIYYAESLEGYSYAALGDDLDMRYPADVPMAALWTSYSIDEQSGIINHVIDMIGAASVAHLSGKRFVGCEAMTSANEPWAFSPRILKPYVDLAFALGINRPIVHTSVHQPNERKPGMSLGCFGQNFTRHETWAEFAGAWVCYLTRTSYLLQQGSFVADIAWFYGEEGSAAALASKIKLADFPSRFGFDLVSPRMLLEELSARDGQLVSRGGANYRLLYLGGDSHRMTLSVLRKLKELSDQGVPIAGNRPTHSPSLGDWGQSAEYADLVSALWNSGRVIECEDPEKALAALAVEPDFDIEKTQPDTHIRFLHRHIPDGELYFLTNRRARAERIVACFRVKGRRPERWHAHNAEREALSWRRVGEVTHISLDLCGYDSTFIVFREPTEQQSEEVIPVRESLLTHLDGPWELSFESGRGAPTGVHSVALGSWTESEALGIRYFSGIGTYRKVFEFDSWRLVRGARVMLDLGGVRELAEVTLNDRIIGTVWHVPFRLDVTHALRPGSNRLRIRVPNLWVNRLIGDQQPGETPVAFTVTSTYRANAPLRSSGLLGPVTVIQQVS